MDWTENWLKDFIIDAKLKHEYSETIKAENLNEIQTIIDASSSRTSVLLFVDKSDSHTGLKVEKPFKEQNNCLE